MLLDVFLLFFVIIFFLIFIRFGSFVRCFCVNSEHDICSSRKKAIHKTDCVYTSVYIWSIHSVYTYGVYIYIYSRISIARTEYTLFAGWAALLIVRILKFFFSVVFGCAFCSVCARLSMCAFHTPRSLVSMKESKREREKERPRARRKR